MMESVKKIKFYEHECTCGEKDEFGQPLECLPFACSIYFCPIKQLINIIHILTSKANLGEK